MPEEKFGSWMYNVRDKFKPMEQEDIIAELNKTSLPCAVMMSQVERDFNFACVIRNSNSFNVKEIFYFGHKQFDRRAAQGSYHYKKVQYLSSFEEIKALKADYDFVAIENNVPGTLDMRKVTYAPNTLFIFGEEGGGIPAEIMDLVDYKVEIPSRGSIRSLNVASACAITLYDYYAKGNW